MLRQSPRILLALCLLLLPTVLRGASAEQGIRLTYLANEGFLIEAGETRVLVDALFGDGLRGYPVVPPAIREDLESARGRFAGVDLVLASHHHGDHFDAAAVSRHLRANPGAAFLSTRQAVAALERELGEEAAGRDIVGVLPGEGETARLELPGLELEALNLHHGRERRPPVENLGLLLRLGGVTLLHVGDTEAGEADLEPYREALAAVDLWLLPSWLLGEPPWQTARGRAGWLVAMHLPAADAPRSWFGRAESLGGYVASLEEALPEAWIPGRALESRGFRPAEPPGR